MALDPANPPIWLRKLHVCAEQISPEDYAPTPEEGILLGCRLSDGMYEWSLACARTLGLAVLPPRLPFENPFRLDAVAVTGPLKRRGDGVIP